MSGITHIVAKTPQALPNLALHLRACGQRPVLTLYLAAQWNEVDFLNYTH
jgi:hypothetical protein